MGTAFLMGHSGNASNSGNGGSSCMFHRIDNWETYYVYPDDDGGVQITNDIYVASYEFYPLPTFYSHNIGNGEYEAFYNDHNGNAYMITKFPLYDDSEYLGVSGWIALVRRLSVTTEE